MSIDMPPSRRAGLRTYDVFDEGPWRIVTAVRDARSQAAGEIRYEFRVYRGDELRSRVILDFHPDIGPRGSYFLEEIQGDSHRTLERFDRDPGYPATKARVLLWLRHLVPDQPG